MSWSGWPKLPICRGHHCKILFRSPNCGKLFIVEYVIWRDHKVQIWPTFGDGGYKISKTFSPPEPNMRAIFEIMIPPDHVLCYISRNSDNLEIMSRICQNLVNITRIFRKWQHFEINLVFWKFCEYNFPKMGKIRVIRFKGGLKWRWEGYIELIRKLCLRNTFNSKKKG